MVQARIRCGIPATSVSRVSQARSLSAKVVFLEVKPPLRGGFGESSSQLTCPPRTLCVGQAGSAGCTDQQTKHLMPSSD